MVKDLPVGARECRVSGVYITPDARVFKKDSHGYKPVSVKSDKKKIGRFYNGSTKKYYSLIQAYAEAFVPNTEEKPLAFVKDASKGLTPDNIMWATNEEWLTYWKENSKRKCKCCGGLIDADMISALCKSCFAKMLKTAPDNDETKRFQERVAATGFDPTSNRFTGRQRDALELFCSGEPLTRIASVLGCDLQTASACIKSAKTARTLEKMSTDQVTPLGYRSAETIPSTSPEPVLSVMLQTERTDMSADENAENEVVAESEVIAENEVSAEAEVVSDANAKELYEQQTLCFDDGDRKEDLGNTVTVEADIEADVTKPMTVTDIVRKLSALLGCDFLTAVKCYKFAASVDSRKNSGVEPADVPTDATILDMIACVELGDTFKSDQNVMNEADEEGGTDLGISNSNCTNIVPYNVEDSISAKATPDSVVSVEEHRVTQNLINESQPVHSDSVQENSGRKASELDFLFSMYKSSGATVPFSSYCKVYWLAGKYTERDVKLLTTLAIRYLLLHNFSFSVQRVNDALRKGMQAIRNSR